MIRGSPPGGAQCRCVVRCSPLALVVAICFAVPTGEVAAAEAPLPAGRTPSTIATMICKPKARQEIASVLGEFATVSHPTWVNHLYSCQYKYPTGSMVLSVKELSSWAQTKSYFRMLAKQMGTPKSSMGSGRRRSRPRTDRSSCARTGRYSWSTRRVSPLNLASHPRARMPSRRRSQTSFSAVGTATEPGTERLVRMCTQGSVRLKSKDTGVPPNVATTWNVDRPGCNSTKSV